MAAVARLPIVGVMGSASEEHRHLSEPLGRALAELGVHLLNGAGGGVMAAVSRAFVSVAPRKGVTIGIVPGAVAGEGYRPRDGYPNDWIEIPVFTHLPLSGREGADPLSRNHINVLTADVVVALPGSWGTASEVALSVRYRRPVIALVERAADIPDLPQQVPRTGRVEDAIDFVRAQLRDRLT